ncbi:predicted protein [Nematostella vectensis]|uniref:RAB5-interacting protein n=1 Tax=Nematostella vectensis TaxID=45351 RepID=A7S404_NEMVE|nr:predicted protein [Nematostella vectensis]|eukprot:XP_001633689.1 predicted protein [Nematostella vectensis]
MTTLKRSKSNEKNGEYSVSDTFRKALKSGSTWEDKEEFLDVIYWLRQILAVVIGILWGLVPLKGIFAIALFCIINAAAAYVYFNNFQKIDEDDYGGPWELTKEGFMTSFAVFLVRP